MFNKLIKKVKFGLDLENYQKMIWGKSSLKGLLLGLASYFIVVLFSFEELSNNNFVIILLLLLLFSYIFLDFNNVLDINILRMDNEILLFKSSNILFGGIEDQAKRIILRAEIRRYSPRKYKVKKKMEDEIYNQVGDHPAISHVTHYNGNYVLMSNNLTSKPYNAEFLVKNGYLDLYKDSFLFKRSGFIHINSKGKLKDVIEQVENSNYDGNLSKALNKNSDILIKVDRFIQKQASMKIKGVEFYRPNDSLNIVLKDLFDKVD